MSTSMKIEVIGRETIKPSSPTPSNLRNFKLSFLDQQAPITYIQLVLFYPFNCSNEVGKICRSLKASLSKSLTMFYPFAGLLGESMNLLCSNVTMKGSIL
ncbi:hypothetical protein Dsin_010581 [Dipteronia sinensis]|uniref:Uncharacterized protein n=1 Tax=Dipteronia sinensis TaxID=43782 RepID=A0AAE0ASR9_9ROSI|nr:hypothetical protein Dsin_010581 [Dipteronia sinensis]